MTKSKKGLGERWLSFLLACLFVLGASSAVSADAGNQPIQSRAAIAIDANTGQVLYKQNANKPLPVASMSKLVTSYIVLQKIHNHQLQWSTKVSVSPAVAKLSTKTGMTNVPLKTDQQYTVNDLYQAGLIGSANDAEMALGNKISGSPAKFAKLENQTVKKMGIKNAKLYNACGLTNGAVGKAGIPGVSKKAENKLSADDMAILSQKIISTYPEILNVTKKTDYQFNDVNGKEPFKVKTSNLMLPGQSEAIPGIKVDGLKTGLSPSALGNFTGTATKDGHRIITVIIGTKNPDRFAEDKKLMQNIYSQLKPVTITQPNNQAQKFPVVDGKTSSVRTKLQHPITVWQPKSNQNLVSQNVQISSESRDKDGVLAPIKKNQKIASDKFGVTGQKTQFLVKNGNSVAVKASSGVHGISWWGKIEKFFENI